MTWRTCLVVLAVLVVGCASADAAPDTPAEPPAPATHDRADAQEDGRGADGEDRSEPNERDSPTAETGSILRRREPQRDDCDADQVDVNRASLHELERIVHIGPSRAEQIAELRPFSNLRDLTRVPGIAETRLGDIEQQGLVCVGETDGEPLRDPGQ